jgi:LPS-assembly protein
MEASYHPHERWQLMTDLQWDQENNNIDQGSVAVQLRGDQERLFNLAFRYREKTDVFLDAPPLLDPRIKQTDMSAVWPLNENWRMLGRWNYDHSNSRNLERTEYQTEPGPLFPAFPARPWRPRRWRSRQPAWQQHPRI